jgi:hypothetical protein
MSVFSTVPLAVFGPGSLYVTRIDIANQTPVNIGYAQEFSYDEAAETKELYGTNQYALVAARGTIKATGKIKAATLSGLALNAVFNGQSFNVGQLLMAIQEAQTIPAAVTHPTSADTASGDVLPFTSTTGVVPGMSVSGTNIPANTFVASVVANTSVTLTQNVSGDVPNATTITFGPSIAVTNASTFNKDLGVIYASSGLPLMYVTGSPATGQYTYIGTGTGIGEYSFASADATEGVLITYGYTSNTGGQTITVKNTPIGTTPVFQIDYSSSLYGNPYYVRFFAAISSKLTRAHKLTDFVMPEVDFGFFANSAQQVYEVSYPQVS